MSHKEEATGETQDMFWEGLGIPPEELDPVSGEEEGWASLPGLLAPPPGPGYAEEVETNLVSLAGFTSVLVRVSEKFFEHLQVSPTP